MVDNAEAAIRIASHRQIDLVLMDIRLSGKMDGIEAAQQLRNKYDIPSIFLTAFVDDQTVSAAKKAYPVGYLQKPFDDADLKASIEIGLFKEELQRKLITQENRLRLAHRIAKLSYWEWDVETNTGYIPPEGLDILGLPRNYFESNKFLDKFIQIIHTPDQESFLKTFNAKVFKFERFETEFRRSIEGHTKHIYFVAETVEVIDNTLKYVSGVFQDVSEMRKTELELRSKERQLQEAQKLESLGRLSGAIAHDFNNYLTLIMGGLQLLMKSADKNMKYYEQFNVVLDTLKYASSLTNQLLTFSRKKSLSPEIVDVNVQILEISELLKILAKEHNFILNLNAVNPHISADSSQFQQILLNLVSNSVEAMPNSGIIQIVTSNISLSPENEFNLSPGKYLKLQVIDNGVGMEDDLKRHAFEPYFTSDISGQHSGIGLSTVYSITKQFGGEVVILDNRNESGVEFQFYFPSYITETNHFSENLMKKSINGVMSSAKSILIIEDNPDILDLMKTIIEEEGNYQIHYANNGSEGLNKYEELNEVDLVITDVLLPGMSGTDLVDEIIKQNNDQSILLISGFVDSLQLESYLSKNVQFLPKPFMIEEMVVKIKTLFGEKKKNV